MATRIEVIVKRGGGDTTDGDDRLKQIAVTDALHEILGHRAVIEQAKGVLMMVYGVSADTAFETLRWRSQETNIKLRVLAERIIAEFTAINAAGPACRAVYDNALMTLHERIP